MIKCKNHIMTHDAFIKRVMSQKEVAKEFFEANLPKSILKAVDLSTLKQEKSDFIDKTLKQGTIDVLYSVQYGTQLGYISLLLEHQSKPDRFMTFRIQKYMLRVCDAHILKYPKSKLPLIYPLILYTGKTKYTAPLSFWDLFSEPKPAKQYFTDPVHLLELRDVKDIDLKHRYHSGIILYLMKEIHRRDILPYIHKLQPLLHLISKENLHFIEDMLRYILDNAETKQKESVIQLFVEAVTEKDKGKIMTIANEFRQEGVQQGIHAVVKNMLAEKMNIDTIARVTKLSPKEIKKFEIVK